MKTNPIIFSPKCLFKINFFESYVYGQMYGKRARERRATEGST